MNEQELHNQKFQAQLAEWKESLAKLRAKGSGPKTGVQIKFNKRVEKLDSQIQEAFWGSVKSTVREAVSNFED